MELKYTCHLRGDIVYETLFALPLESQDDRGLQQLLGVLVLGPLT
jgi:hypothetical protein